MSNIPEEQMRDAKKMVAYVIVLFKGRIVQDRTPSPEEVRRRRILEEQREQQKKTLNRGRKPSGDTQVSS